jgi:histidine triad (HIT) family protein
MSGSIFLQIISGKIPSYKIFENDHVFAFLTKDAIQLGHSLIVPKVEIDYFVDVPEPYYSAVYTAAKPLARAIHQATGCKRVGTIVAGWDVPHFHYHLVPMFDYFDLDPKRAKQFSHNENKRIQEKILSLLDASFGEEAEK